jgi:hypothetical protein
MHLGIVVVSMNNGLKTTERLSDSLLSVSAIGDSAAYTFTKRKEGKGFPWTTILCAI